MSNTIGYAILLVIFGIIILIACWLDKRRAQQEEQLRLITQLLCAECGHPRLKHIPLDGCTRGCDCPWDGNS